MAVKVTVNPNDGKNQTVIEHDRQAIIDIQVEYTDGFKRDITLYIFGRDLGKGQGGCAKNISMDTPEPYKP